MRSPSAELHFHLLPEVDDGPADIGETIELARAAVDDGTRTIVATPHVREDFATDVRALVELAGEVRRALHAAGVPVSLRCGAELGHGMVARLRQGELEAVAHGPRDARWVLVETPFDGIDGDFHAATRELRARDLGVLLAHPERCRDTHGVRREVAAGSLLQINAASITGEFGEAAQRAAYAWLREGGRAVVASDAHGVSRPPALSVARDALIRRGFAATLVDELVLATPWRLLQSGIPAVTRPAEVAA